MSEEVVEVADTPTEAPNEAVETATPTETTVDTPEVSKASEQAFSDSWLGKLEAEDLKGDKTLERLKGKSEEEIARYIKELASWNGKKGDIPAKDASDEEKEAFAIKMGRPETIDGYDFNINDDFSEVVGADNVPYYQQKVDGFKEKG